MKLRTTVDWDYVRLVWPLICISLLRISISAAVVGVLTNVLLYHAKMNGTRSETSKVKPIVEFPPVMAPVSSSSPVPKSSQLEIRDLLDKDCKRLLSPNSTEPIEFENEFFKGKFLFLIKTNQMMPKKWTELFRGRRRLFWVQVQGKFKKKPKGMLYMGGEVPNRMRLGLISKGFCTILLALVKRLVPGLHFSFGDRQETEYPHISFPLHRAVDEFVHTSQNQTPPSLGTASFGESKESRNARRKHHGRDTPFDYVVGDTYTFGFHSYFINFEEWKLSDVPGLQDMPLSTFWQDMPFRLVAYQTSTDRHEKHQNQYVFNFALRPPSV